jgi:hypothetical protein
MDSQLPRNHQSLSVPPLVYQPESSWLRSRQLVSRALSALPWLGFRYSLKALLVDLGDFADMRFCIAS